MPTECGTVKALGAFLARPAPWLLT